MQQSQLLMGELGSLLREIEPIHEYLLYLYLQIGRIITKIGFTLWFAQFVNLFHDLLPTNLYIGKSSEILANLRIGQIIMEIWFALWFIQFEFYGDFICSICLIWFVRFTSIDLIRTASFPNSPIVRAHLGKYLQKFKEYQNN